MKFWKKSIIGPGVFFQGKSDSGLAEDLPKIFEYNAVGDALPLSLPRAYHERLKILGNGSNKKTIRYSIQGYFKTVVEINRSDGTLENQSRYPSESQGKWHPSIFKDWRAYLLRCYRNQQLIRKVQD